MKHYCTNCCFYKEDSQLRQHPILERQGVSFGVWLCDPCYDGLSNRKQTMREWLNNIVRIPYTVHGLLNKLEDTTGVLISTVQHVILRTVSFQTKGDMGYVVGQLETYSFEDQTHTTQNWAPVFFTSQVKARVKMPPLFYANGHNLQSCSRFMLLGNRGFAQ